MKILNVKPNTYILMIMDKIPSIPPNPKLLMGCLWTLPENMRICRNSDLYGDMSLIR